MRRPADRQGELPTRGATLLRAAIVLGSLGLAGEGSVAAAQPPTELKMILRPGQGNSGAIIFSADGEGVPAGQEAAREEPPMTVLPPEAAADSAAQLAALEAGRERPRILAYPNTFSLGAGYRWDSLFFNIATANRTPNVLSELTYDNLESMTLSAGMRWSNSSNIYVRGGVEIGRTISGDVQDSDYLGDNRTMEFSRSHADSDGGSLIDANIGVGYRFDIPFTDRDRSMHLMPLVGFAYHSQELTMTDGVQAISDYGFGMPLGPFAGLNSSYDAHWSGVWIGLDMELAFDRRHALLASLEYHWMNYEADADWNLRSDFAHPVSFEHDANGNGLVASITYRYTPNPKWFWTVGYKYSTFEADAGEYKIFSADGREFHARFNEAEWESHTVMVGLGFKF